MRSSISHPKNDLKGIRSHNPTTSSYHALVLKQHALLVKLLDYSIQPVVPHLRSSIGQVQY